MKNEAIATGSVLNKQEILAYGNVQNCLAVLVHFIGPWELSTWKPSISFKTFFPL